MNRNTQKNCKLTTEDAASLALPSFRSLPQSVPLFDRDRTASVPKQTQEGIHKEKWEDQQKYFLDRCLSLGTFSMDADEKDLMAVDDVVMLTVFVIP